ncbi:hypothetical protein [Sphaerothrix gracilis]|uniref:hypothetical protein n=1 Tax=Sphaerothrix gracilis TaxID=3151835 RepID=UPI0031FE280C
MFSAISRSWQPIRRWLTSASSTDGLEVTDSETTGSILATVPLPAAIAQKFSLAIADLSLPQTYQDTLRSQVDEALQQWRSDPQVPNHLVIITEPTEPLEKYRRWILEQGDWAAVALLSDWAERPPDYTVMVEKLTQAVETVQAGDEPGQVIVLPSLDQCFLRCADGLAGIDYLRDAVTSDRNHFWVLSCNQWAWRYLDSVCHIQAYFKQIFRVPKLDGLALKQWLSPLEASVDHTFKTAEQAASEKPAAAGDEVSEQWASPTEQQYFETLAAAAGGISQVAAALWLRSLGYQEAESTSEPVSESNSVILKKLAFTQLPDLTASDRYLLFSLTLHRTLSIAHLALSLGNSIDQTMNQSLPLQRQDLIAVAHASYQLNPAYYLSLRANLRRNNFIVD